MTVVPPKVSDLEPNTWFVGYDPDGTLRDWGFDYTSDAIVLAYGFNSPEAAKDFLVIWPNTRRHFFYARVKTAEEYEYAEFKEIVSKFFDEQDYDTYEYAIEVLWLIRKGRGDQVIATAKEFILKLLGDTNESA